MKFLLLFSAVLGISQAFLPRSQQRRNINSNTKLSQNSVVGHQNTVAGERDIAIGNFNNLYGIGLDVRGNKNQIKGLDSTVRGNQNTLVKG
jgi:hypothetical protein